MNKHFTMNDYREVFSGFRQSLTGGRSRKQKVSNLYALGKKTHVLKKYFYEYDNINIPSFDLVESMPYHAPILRDPSQINAGVKSGGKKRGKLSRSRNFSQIMQNDASVTTINKNKNQNNNDYDSPDEYFGNISSKPSGAGAKGIVNRHAKANIVGQNRYKKGGKKSRGQKAVEMVQNARGGYGSS